MTNIDKIGLGTYKLNGNICTTIVEKALRIGYRTIDTADLYKNHCEISQGIKNSEVSRDEICLISKIKLQDIKKNRIKESIDKIIKELDINSIDIILLHGPLEKNKNISSWKSLMEIKNNNIVDQIGVSNYSIQDIENITSSTSFSEQPYLNQIELHPYNINTRKQLVSYCKNKNIIMQAYCGLVGGEKMNDIKLIEIAKKYNISIPQLLLKWGLNNGFYQIPKTSNMDHLKENISSNVYINFEDINMDIFNDNYFIFKQWNI